MNFLKSVFSDDPTPPDSPPKSPTDPNPTNSSSESPTTWSFGGLIKTLATKSESVLETYRRDIEELGSGLRTETSLIKEVASRAVKDLPASLEAGASVAQDSLESVGQAIDDLGSSVAALLRPNSSPSSSDPEISPNNNRPSFEAKYSRIDAQIRGLQGDLDTYCSEPEDKEDYEEWRLRFWVFNERKEGIERLIRENEVVREAFDELVPSRVDTETFWRRYFYRLDRLKQAEEARALIVKRAISGDGEEDLSWDFDEDEDEDEDDDKGSGSGGNVVVEEEDKVVVEDGKGSGDGDGHGHGHGSGSGDGNGNGNGGESCKDSDVSVVSSQSGFAGVEDLGWDEVEYSGSNDEGKGEVVGSAAVASSSSIRVDLRKRMNAGEDDEDLSWDIDDEDEEPAKS